MKNRFIMILLSFLFTSITFAQSAPNAGETQEVPSDLPEAVVLRKAPDGSISVAPLEKFAERENLQVDDLYFAPVEPLHELDLDVGGQESHFPYYYYYWGRYRYYPVYYYYVAGFYYYVYRYPSYYWWW